MRYFLDFIWRGSRIYGDRNNTLINESEPVRDALTIIEKIF